MKLETLLLVVIGFVASYQADECNNYNNRGYLFHNKAMNFNSAVKYCQDRGLTLTTVRNSQHNTWLFNKAQAIKTDKWWIGVHDPSGQNQWKNLDGSNATFKKWKTGEPNNLKTEKCVHLGRYSNAQWNDARCSLENRVICESESTQCQGQDILTVLSDNEQCGSYNTQGYLFVDLAKTQSEADVYCAERNMKLATIKCEGHNKWLTSHARAIRNTRWWISANDKQQEGVYKNKDGTSPAYISWHAGEPNNAGNQEDCVVLNRYSDDGWNDSRCSNKFRFICEAEAADCSLGSQSTVPMSNGAQCGSYGNNGYLFKDLELSQNEANAYCSFLGMKLVTVMNQKHNKWLSERAFSIKPGKWWLGANDKQTENQFKNIDGSTVDYTKWHSQEPNNYKDEDCVHIGFFSNEDWNDIDCSSLSKVICQSDNRNCKISPLLSTCKAREGKTYYFVDREVNYSDAELYCNTVGMSLVTVDNAELDTWLYTTSKNLLKFKTWMGLNDKNEEGSWIWHSGANPNYRNWHSGEPNNANNEDCTEYGFFDDGSWNDIPCNLERKFICESSNSSC